MRIKHLWVGLALSVLVFASAKADDLRSNYIGKNSCAPELQLHRFNIRLDKRQNTYIATRQLNGKAIAMIVQFKNDKDECGTVRDIVQSQDSDTSFGVECVDPMAPAAVAVGTRHSSDRRISGNAIEAWRVNLEALKFVPIRGRVKCSSWRSYAGNDRGEDLATWATQRAAKPVAPKK